MKKGDCCSKVFCSPLKLPVVIKGCFEVLLLPLWVGAVRRGAPYAKYVIYIAFVVEETVAVVVEYFTFMVGIVQYCICAGWEHAHGCACKLFLLGTAKLHDIVFHDEAETQHDSISREAIICES